MATSAVSDAIRATLPSSHRYKLTIQYKGTRYKGWQNQIDDPTSKRRSIQYIIEDVLRSITKTESNLVIAGRTDAGVHALGNVGHVDISRAPKRLNGPIPEPLSCQALKLGLNFGLKHHTDLLITKVELVDQNFHARFSATERSYAYRIVGSPTNAGRPFEGEGRWFLRNELNLDLMQQACAILQGRHDYTTFKVTSDPAPAVRTVDELKVVRDEADMFSVHPHAAHSHQKFTIMAKSRSFMTHQVRKMVAAVVGCGMGVMTPAKVAQILEARNPALCPTMAPPNGLYLTNIVYPPHQIFESSAETFDALHEHLDAVSWNRHGKPRMRRVLTAEYEESN